MPLVIGRKIPKPPKEWPLIEIAGPVDNFKQALAKLLAMKLDAGLITYPNYSANLTGYNLLRCLSKGEIIKLETEPMVWHHMYVANLLESQPKLETLRQSKPTIVTNYIASLRAYMVATGIDVKTVFPNFCSGLHIPNMVFLIPKIDVESSDIASSNVSALTQLKIERYFSSPQKDGRMIRVPLEEGIPIFSILNKMGSFMSDRISSKYGIENDPHIMYTRHEFITKTDLKSVK